MSSIRKAWGLGSYLHLVTHSQKLQAKVLECLMRVGNHEVICMLHAAQQSLHEVAGFMQEAANRRQTATQQDPAAWQEIAENVYMHGNRRQEKKEHISDCNCVKPVDASLGCGKDCLNRMLNVECHPVSAAHTDAQHISTACLLQSCQSVLPLLTLHLAFVSMSTCGCC